MNAQQARNTVALLQREPFYYRNFGIWWWYIKSELKRHGFDKAQLQHLGPYMDASVAEYYAGKTRAEMDFEAFDYQYERTFANYNDPNCMTPDGDPYLIHDQDAE